MADFDAIVVGAGPAGAAAALELARAGRSVCLLERGPFPGSKNMYGGVVYGRILDTLIPRVVGAGAHPALGHPPGHDDHDGPPGAHRRLPHRVLGRAALQRRHRVPPRLRRLAGRHGRADAGATLLCSTTATGLLRDGDRVVGVRTDRPDGDLTADVVIACDGVNSFLAKEAGLYGEVDAANYTVGVKETIALPRDVIDERFGVRGDHGVDYEIIGCTGDVPGGGFIYTNAGHARRRAGAVAARAGRGRDAARRSCCAA